MKRIINLIIMTFQSALLCTLLLGLIGYYYSRPYIECLSLYGAIEKKNYEKVELLLKSDCCETDRCAGFGPISRMFPSDFEVLNSFLSYPFEGVSPFYFAIINQDDQMIQLFLENGADINAENGTPLMLLSAIESATADTAAFLIKSGADVNALNHISDTPLIFAALYNNIELAKLLIENGADAQRCPESFADGQSRVSDDIGVQH